MNAFRIQMIEKYVKDLKGLLEEIQTWGGSLIGEDMYHDAVVFHWGRLFRFLNFERITFGPSKGWKRKDAEFDAKFDAARARICCVT